MLESKMDTALTIGAKNLAALAMDETCRRCFWIKSKLKWSQPWAIFPGIFSTLDSYTKKFVASYFQQAKAAPKWLAHFGTIAQQLHAPSYKTFKAALGNTLISGEADGVFLLNDHTVGIADFKLSAYTDTQSKYHPLYTAQLNVYAWIWEALNPEDRVSTLALVYMVPDVEFLEEYGALAVDNQDGFRVGFRGKIVPCDLKPGLVKALVGEYELLLANACPPPSEKCRDCKTVDAIRGLFP